MWWPFQWLVIYVLGGVTFIPVLIISIIAYVYKYGSVPVGDSDPYKEEKARLQENEEKVEQVEKSKALLDQAEKPLSGWLTVRRQFHSNSQNSKNVIIPTNSEEPLDDDGGQEAIEKEKGDSDSVHTNSSTSGTTTYSARIAQTYRSMVELRAAKKEPLPREFFFCVLKGSVLFLYEDETKTNCVAALGVDQYVVRMEKEDGRRFKGKDSELFSKRNAVVLRVVKGVAKKGLPVITKGMQAEAEEGKDREIENKPIFLFTKSNTKMEDWYMALLKASSQSPQAITSQVYDPRDMQTLVETIDTEPDPIPMRWFNAMIGRIFFSLYKTDALEQFIISRIMKKMTRVNRPGFLGPIVVREVNVGTSVPFFSKPMLKDLTSEGTSAFEAHMQYKSQPNRSDSDVRITIATTATIPTGFKPYVVDLVLAVVVKSFEGNLVMQMKKPPSNRFWYGFTSMPKMEIEIVPIVSERKIQIGMVLKAIEKQIRDVIAESVVLPNMDDIAFFDTSRLDLRGGIFDEASKMKQSSEVESSNAFDPKSEIEVQTSNEDPSSAIPSTSNLRKRNPHQKSKSTDIRDSLKTEEIPEIGISRTDTAPPSQSNNIPAPKAAAIQATKKWFAQTGTAQPPSLANQTVTGGLSADGQDDMKRQRSQSKDRVPKLVADSNHTDANYANTPEIAAVQVSSSTMPLSEAEKKSLEAIQPSEASSTPRGEINIHRLSGTPRPSSTSSVSMSSTDTGVIAPPETAQSSSASLISTLRSRDKKAIQAQVGTARESLKKWGVGLAAKRRAMKEGFGLEEETRSPALYRPPEEDQREDERSVLSTSPHRSLQDRLNAAAHASVAPVPMNIPSRGRSSSSSSRPSLFASPKSAASPASTSPPKWSSPSVPKTTTGIIKDGISPQPNPNVFNPSQSQQSLDSPPVSQQPTSGRSMVVPRVPKRPGQVTGIGHNAAEPMVRRVSTEDGLREERIEDVQDRQRRITQPLLSKDSPQNITDIKKTPFDIPSPAKPSIPDFAVPPPLPSKEQSRTASMSDFVSSVSSDAGEPYSPPAQTDHLIAPDSPKSVTGLPSISTDSTDLHAVPNIDKTSPRITEAQVGSAISPGRSSTAEDSLRNLVAKNEEALKARKSEPSSPNLNALANKQLGLLTSGNIEE
ncbi:uncharacterized protein IL334_004686 [Kwoniella shivajii]|uniref:SMP-LTD domain-containing protein n=1 Tax=Kwoniella shivajii TaxID=564305 RepID=A0ABZ1D2Y0_9TREE|nr:hypothetical protein IL334_004686 [Kwoniella shivajii]